MYKLILPILIIVFTISCETSNSKQDVQITELLEHPTSIDTTNKTKIIVDKLKEDLGVLVSGEVVECQFTVTNVGNNPLCISNFTTSGGGLIPQRGFKNPILVGERAVFKLKFNTKGKRGIQSKTARIIANTIPSNTFVEFVSDVRDSLFIPPVPKD